MKISISRLWHNPIIKTSITQEGIGLEMSLEDFRRALLDEIGSVSLVFTKKDLEKKVNLAFEKVVEGIKAESAKHIG